MIFTDHETTMQISSISMKKNGEFLQSVTGKIAISANRLQKVFANFINPDVEKNQEFH